MRKYNSFVKYAKYIHLESHNFCVCNYGLEDKFYAICRYDSILYLSQISHELFQLFTTFYHQTEKFHRAVIFIIHSTKMIPTKRSITIHYFRNLN
jgi:hypothetical protein